MKLSIIPLCFAVLFGCVQNTAIVDSQKQKLDSVCTHFMNEFSHGKYHDAYDLLKKNSILDGPTIDTLEITSRKQMLNLMPTYGKMLSFEFVKETKVNNVLARRYYILKFENYYLKFDFVLYNNGNVWTITAFHFNEDWSDLGL